MLPRGERPLSDPNAGGPVVLPEDRPEPRGERPLLVRLLPLLIVVVALGGFGGIVGYYYFASSSGGVEGVAPLVRADERPVRVRPENPGGMDVPHQDKEIYNKVAGRSAPAPSAERLLPPPETPLPRPTPPATAATADAVAVLGASGPIAPGTLAATPPRPGGAPPPPQPSVPPAPDVAPPPPSAVTSRTTIPPPAPGSTALPGAARPAPTPPSPPAAASPAPAPQTAAAAPRVAGGSRVVLASVQSEADARREWERLRRQYGEALSGMTPEFVRTDLGERGVYWRIYVGPAESAPDAQARCAALKQRSVNCFVARPQ